MILLKQFAQTYLEVFPEILKILPDPPGPNLYAYISNAENLSKY